MRLRFYIHWILSAISLLGYAQADELTHRREKMVLYLLYDVICDVYGADVQKMIYAQNPKHPWPRMRNIGTKMTDGRFLYQEFMARASGGNMLPADINWNIRSPVDVGIKDALDDLAKNNIGGSTMDVAEASPDLKSWKAPDNDILKTNFVELYERALAKYRQFSLNPTFSTLIGNRGAVLTLLFSQIYNIRREETMGWVAKTLKDKFPNIVAPETASSVEGGKSYKKVNIEASLAAYTDANGKFTGDFGDKFANRAAFISFVDENGKPPVTGEVVSSPSGQHWRIIRTWHKAYGFSLMSLETAKICFRS